MELISKDATGYVWAAIGGGALLLVALTFCCIFRAVKQVLMNSVWIRESTHGLEEAGPYYTVVVGHEPRRRSSAGVSKDRGLMAFGRKMKDTNVVPLGLRGRGVSVPGEELRKHMRQEAMVFADAPVPGMLVS
jgi:hypothetical protein